MSESKGDTGHVFPGLDDHGFIITENKVQTPTGLMITYEGKVWEIAEYQSDNLKKYGIDHHGFVGHGSFGNIPYWKIDKNGDRYFTTTSLGYSVYSKTVNECVYRAVDGFLKMMGLGSLTNGDRRWFANHPLVTFDGVGKGKAIEVVHGMVYPYGLGITKVYLPRMSAISEESRMVIEALGVNPLAIVDRSTTNSEFIEKMSDGETDEEFASYVEKNFRVEFVEDPPGPCIVMTNSKKDVGEKSQNTGNVGGVWSTPKQYSSMGHADYIGPRDDFSGSWVMAMVIGRDVEYRNQEVMDALDVEVESKTPSAKEVKESTTESLSVLNSLVGGKCITKKKTSNKKPTSGGNGKDTQLAIVTTTDENLGIDKYFNEANPTQAMYNYTCPVCGGLVHSIELLDFCEDCGFYISNNQEALEASNLAIKTTASSGVCLACNIPLDGSEICADCGLDNSEWWQSSYICKVHGDNVMYKREIGNGDSVTYMCLGCLDEYDGTDVEAFLSSGTFDPLEMLIP